jgi:hypothetical protein
MVILGSLDMDFTVRLLLVLHESEVSPNSVPVIFAQKFAFLKTFDRVAKYKLTEQAVLPKRTYPFCETGWTCQNTGSTPDSHAS